MNTFRKFPTPAVVKNCKVIGNSFSRHGVRPLQSSLFLRRGYAEQKQSAYDLPIYMIGVAANEFIPPTGSNLPSRGIETNKISIPEWDYPLFTPFPTTVSGPTIKNIANSIFHGTLFAPYLTGYLIFAFPGSIEFLLRETPYLFKSPKTQWERVKRKLFASYKYGVKLTPKIPEYQAKAEELYSNINRAFARKDLDKVDELSTLYVQEQLKNRSEGMDKNWELNWSLDKVVSPTRLVSYSPVSLNDSEPLRYVQLIFRFQNIQSIKMTFPKNPKVEARTQSKQILDYYVFIVDLVSGEMRVSGSVFETRLNDPLPTQLTEQSQIIESMKSKGDLFRSKPAYTEFTRSS
ncbi:MBA1-like protein-domain-containing protein [Lipomyces japonicus]|uniref:MBA1-like protein-domain-containing protein n=1 Tax=Lipomyces japonicus TaxID=56871 RepID=UPI0034CFFC0B